MVWLIDFVQAIMDISGFSMYFYEYVCVHVCAHAHCGIIHRDQAQVSFLSNCAL